MSIRPVKRMVKAKQPLEAIQLAEEGVKLAPDNLFAQWALGDAALYSDMAAPGARA